MRTLRSTSIGERLALAHKAMSALAASQPLSYRDLTPGKLPYTAGIYLITTNDGEAIRGGKTTSLQQRIYSNHLMGSQNGNLPPQLVRDGSCADGAAAREWIREQCEVRFLTSEQLEALGLDLSSAEYFVLAVFRPRYCD